MGLKKDKSSKSADKGKDKQSKDSNTAYKTTTCDNCTPTSSDSVDSTACLTNTPNIHIDSIYVYNFSPDQQMGRDSSAFDTPIFVPNKYQSPAASSGPICRICHEGDVKEDLVSPCLCTGSYIV